MSKQFIIAMVIFNTGARVNVGGLSIVPGKNELGPKDAKKWEQAQKIPTVATMVKTKRLFEVGAPSEATDKVSEDAKAKADADAKAKAAEAKAKADEAKAAEAKAKADAKAKKENNKK